MRGRQFWPVPLIVMGTVLALFGILYPFCNCLGSSSCNCNGSPNYALNIAGLALTVIFTYVFVFLSTKVHGVEQMVSNATSS